MPCLVGEDIWYTRVSPAGMGVRGAGGGLRAGCGDNVLGDEMVGCDGTYDELGETDGDADTEMDDSFEELASVSSSVGS